MKTITVYILNAIKKLIYLASPEGELVSYGAGKSVKEKNNTRAQKPETGNVGDAG